MPGFSRRPETLLLRPKDAKNEPLRALVVVERMDDEVALLVIIEERGGRWCGSAKEGYGSGGGWTNGVISRWILVKSVAAVASGRRGNDASVFIDEPEPCLRWGTNGSVGEGGASHRAEDALLVPRCLASYNHITKPVSQLYNSLIFRA
jgi:hypothetical protein